MKTVKIKFSEYPPMSNEAFANAASSICEAFENEIILFPTPPFSFTVLGEACEALVALNGACEGPSANENTRNDRDLQRTTVYEMIVANGIYALGIANSRETYEEEKAVVIRAGYKVANDTHNPVEKLPVTGLSVNASTMPGIRTIQARWKKGKCDAFIVEATQGPVSPTSTWQQLCVSSRARCEATLPNGGQWAVRVVGVYSSGNALPSEPISFMIG